ncbi:MAG: MFS transporter [Candidatus Methanoliparum thermophilum]|uniref:MFS transporter n=1 Tax=Methanoliparum thermophilum TaxID=2491083 RepID=A0A520KRR2_METT2|nr:MAG: MFS transporter [Candidatus Methanoliparum thermophilum]
MQNHTRRAAYLSIILLGIVSLMGDIVYEGGRSIIPYFLEFLGASAVLIGFVGGLGDFLGYVIRPLAGYWADVSQRYWFFTFLGYFLIISIPFLAFVIFLPNKWQLSMAISLIMIERVGKALRAPSRDTILSIVSKGVGSGKAFGIHETLDQIGAIIGPLIIGLLVSSAIDFTNIFGVLFIPFLILLFALGYAYRKIENLPIMEESRKNARRTGIKRERLNKKFYIYSFAVFVNSMGLINILLVISEAGHILPEYVWFGPIIYVVIMGVDALAAYPSGYFYDKIGIKFLIIPFIFTALASIMVLISHNIYTILIASVLFGIVLGIQESVYRAVITDVAPLESRGTAYGIFNTIYGLGLLIGGVIYGFFIDLSINIMIVSLYAVITQFIAIYLLLRCIKDSKS